MLEREKWENEGEKNIFHFNFLLDHHRTLQSLSRTVSETIINYGIF